MNPRTVVCYICGREFGSLSINIHSPKCLEKWRVENNKLPKSQRRPEPIKPQIQKDQSLGAGKPNPSELQRLNDAAYATAKDAMLSTCDNCQRRFLPPQLIRHQNACRPGVTTFKQRQSVKATPLQKPGLPTRQKTQTPSTSGRPAQSKQHTKSPGTSGTSGTLGTSRTSGTTGTSETSGKKPPSALKLSTASTRAVSASTASVETSKIASFSRPPSRVCYICGREFGTRSIEIHEPQCLEKWRVQNAKQSVESRRPEPEKPTGIQENGVRLTKDQMNDLAYDTFKSNLAQCGRCSRRFLPDRLVVHLRSCKR